MSTPAYVKKLLGVTGGASKLHRDRIMDAGFLAEFDFVSAYCNGGVITGAVGSSFTNLVEGGAAASIVTGLPNGIGAHGLDFGGGGKVLLPDTFKFASNEQHFAIGMVVTPNPTPGASKNISFAGYAYQTGPEAQWLFHSQTDAAGAYTYFRFTSSNLAANQTTNLGWLTDGKSHFVVGEWEVVGTLAWRRLYVDGVLVASSSSTYSSLAQPVTTSPTPVIGLTGAFTAQVTGKVGRIWVKRWATGGGSISAADIAKREYAYYGPAGAASAMFGAGYASTLTGPVDANRFG